MGNHFSKFFLALKEEWILSSSLLIYSINCFVAISDNICQFCLWTEFFSDQVCVFPVFIIGIMLSAGVNTIPKTQTLAFSVIWLLIANSSINPILYGLLNKNFRAVYLVKVKRCLSIPHMTPHKSPGLSSSMGQASTTVMNGTENSTINQCSSRCNFNAVLEDHWETVCHCKCT